MNFFASQEIQRPNAGAKRIKESLCLFLQTIHGPITHDKDYFQVTTKHKVRRELVQLKSFCEACCMRLRMNDGRVLDYFSKRSTASKSSFAISKEKFIS